MVMNSLGLKMILTNAAVLQPYEIQEIVTDKEDVRNFLSSLGFVSGEIVTIISKKKNNLIVNIMDSRYGIDTDLASAIQVREI